MASGSHAKLWGTAESDARCIARGCNKMPLTTLSLHLLSEGDDYGDEEHRFLFSRSLCQELNTSSLRNLTLQELYVDSNSLAQLLDGRGKRSLVASLSLVLPTFKSFSAWTESLSTIANLRSLSYLGIHLPNVYIAPEQKCAIRFMPEEMDGPDDNDRIWRIKISQTTFQSVESLAGRSSPDINHLYDWFDRIDSKNATSRS
jgi:hypothetical protein